MMRVEWDGGHIVFRRPPGCLESSDGEHVFKGVRDVAMPGTLDLGELSGGVVRGKCIPTRCDVGGDANDQFSTKITFTGIGPIEIAKGSNDECGRAAST